MQGEIQQDSDVEMEDAEEEESEEEEKEDKEEDLDPPRNDRVEGEEVELENEGAVVIDSE